MTRATSPTADRRAPIEAPGVIAPARSRRPARPRDGADRARLAATIARWPLAVDAAFEAGRVMDPSTAIVRQSVADYRAGLADRASRAWDDEIAWRVPGSPPVGGEWVGPERVFAYHRLLGRLTNGTFNQRLIALEGSRGAIVDAYLRTTATRRHRTLDIPTLVVFELAGGRIRCVTEMPGDRDAWEAFWAD